MLLLYIALAGLGLMSIGLTCTIFFAMQAKKTMDIANPLLKSYLEVAITMEESTIDDLSERLKSFLDGAINKLPFLYASAIASLFLTILGLVVFATGILGQVWLMTIP